MNYGMAMAASGTLTSLYRMDVLANNLANTSTPGFKADVPAIRQRDAARIEDDLPFMPSSRLLEQLGGGVLAAPNRVRFEQGPLTDTGNPLDLAIQGEGFFVVRDDADAGADRLRLTRDGRFVRDPSGRIVSASTGLPLMDIGNRPIVIENGAAVQIAADGSVRQRGQIVAQIQIASVGDPSRIRKLGHGMFVAPADLRRGAAGAVRQSAVEGSSVDPIAATMAITDAQRTAEASSSMIQAHDRLMDRAINGLGRIA